MSDDEGNMEMGFMDEGGFQNEDEDGFQNSEYAEGESGPCDKICGSVAGCCFGMVLFPVALCLLAYNENNYVCENNRIIYSEGNAKEVECDSRTAGDQFAFFSCPVVQSTLRTFRPNDFTLSPIALTEQLDVSFNAIKGAQQVEMYQCQQSCTDSTRKKRNGQKVTTTSCTYNMDWSESRIDSSSFKAPQNGGHTFCSGIGNPNNLQQNPLAPSNMPFGTATQVATGVQVGGAPVVGSVATLGAFTINDDLLDDISADTQIVLTSGPLQNLALDTLSQPPPVVSHETVIQVGNYYQTCQRQTLGCVRVSFYQSIAPAPTLLTHVNGGLTSAEVIPGSWGCGESNYQKISAEIKTKEVFIADLHGENEMWVWILRVCGLLAAWFGVYCIFSPISTGVDLFGDALSCIPCVGDFLEDVIEGVAGVVICCCSCGIGLSCGLTVIAITWLVMRPLYGGIMLGVAILMCCCVGGVVHMAQGNKKKTNKGRKKDGSRQGDSSDVE